VIQRILAIHEEIIHGNGQQLCIFQHG